MGLIASCSGADKDTARLKGSFKHLQQAQMFVYSDAQAFNRFDTITVKGGDFDYSTPLSEPTVLTILYPNFSETYFVAEPGAVLKMKADAANLQEARITGSAANDSLTAFRERYSAAKPSEQQKAAEAYIRQHPGDMAAVALFVKYFERAEILHAEPTATLLKMLVKAHPQHKGLFAIKQRMEQMLPTAIGSKAPKKMTEGGVPVAYVFTLSSHYNSNEMQRLVNTTVEELKDRIERPATLRVVEISADNCDLDSLCRAYGLHYLPSNILIDAQGTIVSRDVNNDNISKALRRLVP